MSNNYLERYAIQETYLSPEDYGDPGIVIVIPCHKETQLIQSLEALEKCTSPDCKVSVVTVINASEIDGDAIIVQNRETFDEAIKWSKQQPRQYKYHFILENNLPKKHAGVGLARKIGMDEAVRVFESNQKDGVILCFDADSLCDQSLLVEVEKLFSDTTVPGCSIYYEHPLDGDLSKENYEGIISYELHLRYYIDVLKYAGFPYAYQTIGSSMAVRSSAYQKQGGMNRRKAGEDFYFLHRIIPLGNFKNLNTTKIIPSPRASDRVPFGTGKAIGDWLNSDKKNWETYNPDIFDVLKVFFDRVDDLFIASNFLEFHEKLPSALKSFVSEQEFANKLAEIKKHSTTLANFQKRFFQWFDGFKVLKFVHHARDNGYANVEVGIAVKWILGKSGNSESEMNLMQKLILLRKIDRCQ